MKKPTEIMTKKFNPRELAKEQAEAYRKYIIGVLEEIKIKVSEQEYSDVGSMTAHSPAGDGYGLDNDFIDFGFDKKPRDIMEALNYLKYLELYADGEIDLDEDFCEGRDYLSIF